MKPRTLWLANALLLVAVLLMGLSLGQRWFHPELPAPLPPPPGLATMTLPQAMAHCHTLWLGRHWDQAPLALAWQPERLDWYVRDGDDEASMRHFSCDGAAVTEGRRFRRVLHERVPVTAEEAASANTRNLLRDINLLRRYAAEPAPPDIVALEAVVDPADPAAGPVFERRWPAAGAAPVTSAGAPPFGLLWPQAPAGLATAGLEALQPLQPINWLQQPDAVFVLLADHVPAGHGIAAMSFDDKQISVYISGPVKGFEGRGPSPYGSASFDEYGIRDGNWWYPRDSATDPCSQGRSVAEVKALYRQATHHGRPDVYSAAFGCNARPDPGGKAAWVLRVPRRR